MRAEIAKLVFPVIRRALQTQQRLAAGHPIPCETEMAAFKALLLTEREASAIAEFGAEPPGLDRRFRGIRYALACWLDETLGREPLWSGRWAAHALEAALTGTQQGATSFWEQAELALERPGSDVREAFYLCVNLGFRGAWSEAPEKVAAWIKAAKAQLTNDLAAPWPAPPALETTSQAPPLRHREKLHRTLLAVSIPLCVLTPLAAWMIARRLGW